MAATINCSTAMITISSVQRSTMAMGSFMFSVSTNAASAPMAGIRLAIRQKLLLLRPRFLPITPSRISSDARTVSLAQKRLDKLKLQQAECEKYEKNIAHLAGLRIALDLDDGVKVNYAKAQTAADGKNLNVLAPLK